MNEPKAEKALQKAIEKAGGTVALAKLLCITPQAISQWRIAPPRRVLEIEDATGVKAAELRPDMYRQ